MAITVSHSTM